MANPTDRSVIAKLVAEAFGGVPRTRQLRGLDPGDGLDTLRKWFAAQDPDAYIDKIMRLANVEKITMTNAIFDDNERSRWLRGDIKSDKRFSAVLRIDP